MRRLWQWLRGDEADLHVGDAEAVAERLVERLSARDPKTGEHVNRVACIAAEIATLYGLEAGDLAPIEVGARLHDLGKVGVPDSILRKPAALDEREWAVMQRHPATGAALLRALPSLAHLADIVEAHHERWDGRGYPRGLAAEEIPLEARIFALADSIDAMTSDRPYQSARDWGYVRTELEAGAGRQWDPALALLVRDALNRIRMLEGGCPHGRRATRAA